MRGEKLPVPHRRGRSGGRALGEESSARPGGTARPSIVFPAPPPWGLVLVCLSLEDLHRVNVLVSPFVDREGRRRRSRRGRDAGRSLGLESLEGRAVPTVTAIVLGALLIVFGDALDNTITISRDAAGTILVNDNNGQVPITGGTPTVANTALIIVSGGAGNDTISLDETNGALPRACITAATATTSSSGARTRPALRAAG